MKRRILCLLLMVCLLFALGGTTVLGQMPEHTIHIGLYNWGNFQASTDEQQPDSYLRTYLEALFPYTGWHCEFVYAPLQECLSMLERGELDLLAGLQKTDTRAKEYAFSTYSIGQANLALFVSSNRTDVAYEDYQKLDGMTVAVQRGNLAVRDLIDYAKKNDISFTLKEYDTEAQMREDIKQNRVDALLSTSTAGNSTLRCVAQFSLHDYYLAAMPKNKALVQEFDAATERLQIDRPTLRAELEAKYGVPTAGEKPVFTREEQNYLATCGEISVAYNTNGLPVEYQNGAGEHAGIGPDVLELVGKYTGLRFRWIPADSFTYKYKLLEQGEVSLLCAAAYDVSWAQQNGFQISRPYLKTSLVMVRNKQTAGEPMVVAVAEGSYPERIIAHDYPNAKTLLFPDYEDCFDAVARGEANTTAAMSYLAASKLNMGRYSNLLSFALEGGDYALCFAYGPDTDPKLIQIIEKTLRYLSDTQINNIVIDNTVVSTSISPLDFMYAHPVGSVLTVLGIACVVILLLLILLYGRAKHARRIYNLVYQDALTGIWSLRKFREEASRFLGKAHASCAVVYLDIVKFKYINDVYGHSAGDSVLCELADTLSNELREGEMCARIHSDLFVALFFCDSPLKAQERTEELLKTISQRCALRGSQFDVCVHAGLYFVTPIDTDISFVIDRAIYAKAQCPGIYGNECVAYNNSYRDKLRRNRELEHQMEQALESGQFPVYYQPKVNCQTSAVCGAEALVRWQWPGQGLISPGEFIPLFEQNGFIVQLDLYVFEQVCKQLAAWRAEGKPLFCISSNFSRVHLAQTDFIPLLNSIADSYEIPHSLLEIEITESVVANNITLVRHQLEALHDAGYTIAVDDFGSGYSSLGVLSAVPSDIVKLDRSFILSCEHNAKFLRGTISLISNMGKQALCEGVESAEQLALVQEAGCYLVQGYYYAKPMPPQEFADYAWYKEVSHPADAASAGHTCAPQ